MKLSYIVTTHNKELYLAEAVNSLLEQKYKDYEIIVMDDYSDDNTKDIMEYLQSKYKKIRYYRTTKRSGVATTRNLGRSFAEGDIICVLDGDDIAYPGRSVIVSDYFKKNPDIDLMYGSNNIIDVAGTIISQRYSEDFCLEKLKRVNYITHSTLAYRNSVRTRYREGLRYIDDWYFYIDAYADGYKFGCVDAIISAWRMTPESLTYKGGFKTEEKEALKEKLKKEFSSYDDDLTNAMKKPQQQVRIAEILKEIPKGSTVLDVGCNGGYLMHRLLSEDCTVMGVEIADNLIAKCKEKNLDVCKYSAKDLSKVDRLFDCVVYGDILEHYPLEELHDILYQGIEKLNAGGKLIITVPYKHGAYSKKFDKTHKEDYEPKDIEALLRNVKIESRPIFVGNDAVPYWHLITGKK